MFEKNVKRKICIIGLGYIGEHLLSSFSKYEGYIVYGFDIDKTKLTKLTNLSEFRNCKFTDNENNLRDIDLFCVAVPTLLNKHKKIEKGPLLNVKDMLLRVAKEGSTIVIESSLYIGGTRDIFGCFLEQNIHVGFSPERVNPGSSEPAHCDIPKVIAGLNDKSRDIIEEYYNKVIKRIVPVSSTECAEMCKLYENCFRLINIAYVNEVSDYCLQYNINPYEMIHAASSKPFGFMPFTPGLGVGGNCISINPYYMAMDSFDKLPCLYSALKTTESRPEQKALNIINNNKNIKKCLVIGAAFKPGQTLLANSSSIDLVNTFVNNGIDVTIYDPLIDKPECNVSRIKNVSLFNFFKSTKGIITWMNINEFTLENTLDYDIIIVALKQHNVDWNIIKQNELYNKYNKKVYWFIDKNDLN